MLALPFIPAAIIGVAVLLVAYVLYSIDPTVFPSPDNIINDLRDAYNSIQSTISSLKKEIIGGLIIVAVSAFSKKNTTGAYVISFESGKMYVGKGGMARMFISAAAQSFAHGTLPNGFMFIPKQTNDEAFMQEYMLMVDFGYKTGGCDELYNLIWSPGRSIYFAKYGHYYSTDTGA